MELGPTQNVLLRLNRESRCAALNFYRAHLPFNREAKFGPSGSVKIPMTEQMLYFDPEHEGHAYNLGQSSTGTYNIAWATEEMATGI